MDGEFLKADTNFLPERLKLIGAAAMDGEFLKADTNFLPEKLCGARHEHEYDDRISELPDEIKVMILSSLPLREAAAASVISSRWSGLWKHTPDLKFDRISKLPDQIIAGILSFLPLREAASTSVLSSRWSDLWKHTPNLNFEFDTGKALRSWDAHKCKYVELVNSVLQSHKAPSLKQFSISFYLDKSAQLYVNKWLEFVFSRQVESLELNFRLFEEKYMAVLEVEEMLRESRVTSMTDVILSKSLKRLSLQFLKVSGEAMELILCSCPLLEELVIGFVFLTSDVELCGASLMLKHLEISGCRGGKSIKISAPNLEWLSVDELSGKLLLENVPKLRADFNIIFGWQDDLQRFASAVFFCISSQLTILNLTLYAPEMFLAYGLVKMPNLKKLVVGYYGRIPSSLLPLTALIWASPRLEEFKLEIKITRKDPELYKVVKSNVERSPHQHLKVFELAQFFRGNGDNVKELVTYIVNNCIALQKIIFGGRSWFHYCEQFCDFEDDEQARDYAKQQLQDKLPQHIQMQLL